MPSKPDWTKKLAPHVQAVAGGGQPKISPQPPGQTWDRQLAPHVQAAIDAGAQPKMSPAAGQTGGRQLAPHVQAAIAAGGQPKISQRTGETGGRHLAVDSPAFGHLEKHMALIKMAREAGQPGGTPPATRNPAPYDNKISQQRREPISATPDFNLNHRSVASFPVLNPGDHLQRFPSADVGKRQVRSWNNPPSLGTAPTNPTPQSQACSKLQSLYSMPSGTTDAPIPAAPLAYTTWGRGADSTPGIGLPAPKPRSLCRGLPGLCVQAAEKIGYSDEDTKQSQNLSTNIYSLGSFRDTGEVQVLQFGKSYVVSANKSVGIQALDTKDILPLFKVLNSSITAISAAGSEDLAAKKLGGNPIALCLTASTDEDLHAEQKLLLVVAHYLRGNDAAPYHLVISGARPPCGSCLNVLTAFNAALYSAYSRRLNFDSNMGQSRKLPNNLDLEKHFPEAKGTFKEFVDYYSREL